MNLKIFSWNCQSIRNKIPELRRHLESNIYHIILLQETWLTARSKPEQLNIKSYSWLRNDREAQSNHPHGGVAILIHDSLSYKRIRFCSLSFFEGIFIQTIIDSKAVTVGSVYSPSSLKISDAKNDLKKLLSCPGPFVLGGDWNAIHTSWNNVKNNKKGSDLLKTCDSLNCHIHFPDEPTNFPAVGLPSTLDFVISKGISGIKSPIVINDLSSDHIPISFEIFARLSIPPALKIKDYKNADWKKFQNVITREISLNAAYQNVAFESPEEIDSHILKLNNAVNTASQESIPLKSPYVFRQPYSQKIKDLIFKRNAIRRKVHQFPRLKPIVNSLNREIRKETAILNQSSFSKKIGTLNVHDQSLYQFTKCIKKKFTPIPPIAKTCDDYAYSNKEKADLIASAFSKAHQISSNPTANSPQVENSTTEIESLSVNLPSREKIKSEAVTELISRLKVKKAHGHDDLSNRMIKNLPSEGISLLTIIFNACLELGYFPVTWKVGKVIAIPKPGKDQSSPNSYRPITLLPIFGKLFENLILTKLRDFESEKQILINQQYGFRSQHSTTQQIVRLTQTISLRFNENKSSALTLLDLEKAFDSVWHEALLHKLKAHEFPPFLLKIVSSFLTNRVSHVVVKGIKSKTFGIPAGVPQGSPLSPFLFNIFINDIPIPKHCKIAIFADDTALLSSIKNPKHSKDSTLPVLVSRMEQGLKEIHDHFASWKVKLNDAKTETILFTHSKIMTRHQVHNKIKFNGSELDWRDNVKYLGVLLDQKLLFAKNISANVSKAKKAMATLYCLLRKNSSLDKHSKLTLYRAYIRPTMTYACQAFSNCAKSHLAKLQVVQNKCLRMALNAPFRTRISRLHEVAEVPLINEFITKLTDSFYSRASYSENKLTKKLGDYSSISPSKKIIHRLPRKT